MRPARVLVSLATFLALGLPVWAEPGSNVATITQPVYVRSGPSDSYYPTARLNPGDKVTLTDEKQAPWLAEKKLPPPGWLAIKPPEKSFSWVNKRFLKVEGRTAYVTEETFILVGSAEYDQFPNVKQIKVKQGDILVIVGEEKSTPDGVWVMVAPHPQEVRYIPGQAIQANALAPPVQATAAAAPPPAKGPGSETWGSPAPSAAPSATDNQLWTQADKAQQEGRREEAERLYSQLANQTSDANLRIWALNRIEYLRKNAAALVPTSTQPVSALNPGPASPSPAAGVPAYPYGQTVSPPPLAQGRVTSQYAYDREKSANSISPIPGPKSVEQWTDVGELRKSYLQVDGNKVYALEMNNGQRFLYITAYPGLNLDQYLNRKILVFGPILYSGSLRNYYMSATHLRMAQ